jgi:hypothetical protein
LLLPLMPTHPLSLRYNGIRAALQVLSSCARAFGERLLEDAGKLFTMLAPLRSKHQNKDVREHAETGLVSFLAQVRSCTWVAAHG